MTLTSTTQNTIRVRSVFHPWLKVRHLFLLGVLGVMAVQHRFSKSKWKVEWKVDGNNFPLGRRGVAKIVGKIAHQLSPKWNLLSTPKNSEWKMGKNKKSETNRQAAKVAKKTRSSCGGDDGGI